MCFFCCPYQIPLFHFFFLSASIDSLVWMRMLDDDLNFIGTFCRYFWHSMCIIWILDYVCSYMRQLNVVCDTNMSEQYTQMQNAVCISIVSDWNECLYSAHTYARWICVCGYFRLVGWLTQIFVLRYMMPCTERTFFLLYACMCNRAWRSIIIVVAANDIQHKCLSKLSIFNF